MELVYTEGTTNLFNHLRCKHLDEYKVLKGECSSKQQSNIVSFNHSCSPDHARKLTNTIAEFIIYDMRPISTVDKEGFQMLFKLVEPNYTVPSRTHVMSVIHRLYNKCTAQLREEINSHHLALTTNLWTSHATEACAFY